MSLTTHTAFQLATNMIKHFIVILSVSFLVQSCLTSNTLNVGMIDVDHLPEESPKIDSVSFAILKSTSGNYISSVSDIKYRNGKFYIFDITQGLVMVFDKQGNELGHIKKTGHGHDEYIQPMSFDIDNEGNVFIADGARGAIFEYKHSNYTFKKRIDVGRNFCGLGVINENEFWISQYHSRANYDGKLAYYNANSHIFNPICKSIVKGESGILYSSTNFNIFRSDSLLYYHERFTPFVYRLGRNGICSDTLIIESCQLPTKKDVKIWAKQKPGPIEDDKILDLKAFYIADGGAFISLADKRGTKLWHSFDKNKTIKFFSFSDNKFYYLNYSMSTVCDGCFVSWCDVSKRKETSKRNEPNIVKKIIKNTQQQKGNSSFALLFYKLK